MLREILLRDFSYTLKTGPNQTPYWHLPEWNGALIGCTDKAPDYRSYEEYRDAAAVPGFDPNWSTQEIRTASALSSSVGHDGINWTQAADLLSPKTEGSKEWDYLFVEGYGLTQEFAEVAVMSGWSPLVYWIDISPQTSMFRVKPSGDIEKHWQGMAAQKNLAVLLGGMRINGEQQFEAVMADLWTAIMQDVIPPSQLGNLSSETHSFVRL